MNSLEKSGKSRVDEYPTGRLLPTLDTTGMDVLRHIYSTTVDPGALVTFQNEMIKAIPHATIPTDMTAERNVLRASAVTIFDDVKQKLAQYHQMFFMDGIRDLLKQGFGVDVTFILDDGKVGANCSVLVCASPFLKSLLDDSKEHTVVSLPGIKLKTMKDLLGFLYTGCLQHNTCTTDLLEAVHVLGMKELIAILLKSNPPVEPFVGPKSSSTEAKKVKKRKRSTPEPDFKNRDKKPCILGELLAKPGQSSTHIYSSDKVNAPLNLSKSKGNPGQSSNLTETKQSDFQLGMGAVPVQYPGVMETMPTGYNHLLDAFGSYSQLSSLSATKPKSKNSPKKSSHGTILENHMMGPHKSAMTPEMLKDIYEKLGMNKSLADWPGIGSIPPLLPVGTSVGLGFFPNLFSTSKLNSSEESTVTSSGAGKEDPSERSILNLSGTRSRQDSEHSAVPSLKIGNTDLVAPETDKSNPPHAPPEAESDVDRIPVSTPTQDSTQTESGTQTTEASNAILQNSMLMSNSSFLTKFGFDARNPTSFPLASLGLNLSSSPSLTNTGSLLNIPLRETSPEDPGPVDLSSISSRSRISSWTAAVSKPSDGSRDIDVLGSQGPSEERVEEAKAIPEQFLASRLQQTFNLESSRPSSLLHADILFPKQKDSGPATPDSIEVLEENINTEKPPTPFLHPTSNGTNMGRRRKGCGECAGCQEVHDCGQCRFCKDKGKFGGPNRLKQVCINKKCVSTDETEEGRKKKKKIRKKIARCGNCKPCQTTQDCGDCESCLNNASSQPPSRKKTCELRICVEQEMDAFLEKGNVADEPSPYSTDSLRGASLILGGLHAKLFQPLLNIPGQKVTPKKHKKSDPNQKNNPSKARTKYYCGQCSGCMRASPCGNCQYCEDMPKFGGPGRFRQKCMKQLCDHHPRLQTLKASNRTKLAGDILADSLHSVDSKDSLTDIRHPIKTEETSKDDTAGHSTRSVPNLISIVRPEQLMDTVNFDQHYQSLGLSKDIPGDTHSDSDIDVDHIAPEDIKDEPMGESSSSHEPIGKLHIKKCPDKGPTSKWKIKMSPTHSDPDLSLEGNNNESACTTMSCDAVVEQMKPLPIKLTAESMITRGPSICPGLESPSRDDPPKLLPSSMKVGLRSPCSSDSEMDEAIARSIDQIDSSIDRVGDEQGKRRRGRGRSKKRGRRASQSPGAEGCTKKTKRGRKKKRTKFSVDSDEFSDYDEYYFPVPTERDLNKQAAELHKQKSGKASPVQDASMDCEQTDTSTINETDKDPVQMSALELESDPTCPRDSSSVSIETGDPKPDPTASP